MIAGIAKAGAARRTTYDRLTWTSFNMQKPDGRRFGYYWDGDRKVYIYRYRWVWQNVNGPIPDGWHIHHKNGDCTDDRIENLDALPKNVHLKLHGEERVVPPPMFVCKRCGTEFADWKRKKTRRYCSPECYHQAQFGGMPASRSLARGHFSQGLRDQGERSDCR